MCRPVDESQALPQALEVVDAVYLMQKKHRFWLPVVLAGALGSPEGVFLLVVHEGKAGHAVAPITCSAVVWNGRLLRLL